MNKSEIKGETITIRPLKTNIKLAQKIFQEIENSREFLEEWLPWVEEIKKVEDSVKYLVKCEQNAKKNTQYSFGIFQENDYIGNIGIFDLNWTNKSAEIGYWLTKRKTGQGLMPQTISIVEELMFKHYKFKRLQIKCDSKNIASSKVAQKAGFKLEGVLRQEHYNKKYQEFRNTNIYSKINLYK